MSDKVLIIVHQETSSPGRVGQVLAARGYRLDIRRPRFGDPLPETMEDHAAAVIFGGPMSANDPDDFIKREIDWISVALAAEKPFLGVCLGAQMMALNLGGAVRAHPEGLVEIGYYPLTPTAEGRALMDWPGHVYQWHREGFTLPRGAVNLAVSPDYPVQAMRYGKAAYGIQFHPELTLAMMYRWTTKGAERLGLPGAQGRKAHFEGRAIYDPALVAWLEAFTDLWLGGARHAKDRPRLQAAE